MWNGNLKIKVLTVSNLSGNGNIRTATNGIRGYIYEISTKWLFDSSIPAEGAVLITIHT